MSRALVFGFALLLGCGAKEPAQTVAREAKPVPEDPDSARKRECVAALTAGSDPRYHTLMRSLCSEWIELQIPGVALAIVEPGEPVVHVELGVRCLGDAAPIGPSTAFRIGSISKPVTAALALGLVDEGSLALGDEATMVPGFASQAGLAPPRLDALLRHRSGLGEIDPATLVAHAGEWLPALAQSPAAGAVGEYRYSNAGYSLVGAMLETASERRYAELVATRIAAPLELASLTADPNVAAAACGHLASDPDRRPIPIADDLEFMPGDPRWMQPAGGILSSAADLAEFALALGTERLPGTEAMLGPGDPLSPASRRAGHADERYGLGLRSWSLDSANRAHGHSGNNAGFAAELLFVPDRRAIVILANSGVELPASLAAAEAALE